MLTIRHFEERASTDYGAGKIYGVVHCYIGEEASRSASAPRSIRATDHLDASRPRPLHRQGADLNRMSRALRRKPATARQGGAMHIAISASACSRQRDRRGWIAIVTGAGLARRWKQGGVAVSFFGDGASNAGPFTNASNIAAPGNCRCSMSAKQHVRGPDRRPRPSLPDVAARAALRNSWDRGRRNTSRVYQAANAAVDRAAVRPAAQP